MKTARQERRAGQKKMRPSANGGGEMKGNRTENRFYLEDCVCVPPVCFAEGESYDRTHYNINFTKCKREGIFPGNFVTYCK